MCVRNVKKEEEEEKVEEEMIIFRFIKMEEADSNWSTKINCMCRLA